MAPLHTQLSSKRIRSYLRVAFFMLRKGLISKRKLIIDINLMMKRGKLMGKALGNSLFNNYRMRQRGHGYGLQEYEFSCNNSPNPVFFHARRRTRHNYFPCINITTEEDDEWSPTVPSAAIVLPRLLYSPNRSAIAEDEMIEEEEEESGPVLPLEHSEVDDEAEEFIRRFYEQLRRQSRFALLQYEMDYQEMLARGR